MQLKSVKRIFEIPMRHFLEIRYIRPGTKQLQAAWLIGLLSFAVLFLLQPFGEVSHGFKFIGLLRTLSYALVSGAVFYLAEHFIQPYFKRFMPHDGHGQVILWYLTEFFLITCAIFLLKNSWSGFQYLSSYEFAIVLKRTGLIGALPFLGFLFFLNAIERSPEKLVLRADKVMETLALHKDEIVYMKSEDNYTRIFHKGPEGVRSKMLRGSLSHFESQAGFPLVRCHRSFIVNLSAIESFKGNSLGLTLELKNTAESLKVSRKYAADFRSEWERFQALS